MKTLHHEKKVMERMARPLALAGALLLGGCAHNYIPRPCMPPMYENCSSRPRSYNAQNKITDIYGVKAHIVYTVRTFDELLRGYEAKRQKEGVYPDPGGGDAELYAFVAKDLAALAVRDNLYLTAYQHDPTVMFDVQYMFVAPLSTVDQTAHLILYFNAEIDRNPTNKNDPGTRDFKIGRFPEPVFSQMSDAIVVIDKEDVPQRNSQGFLETQVVTAHVLPRAADGLLIGATPLGQLAFSVTFDPMSKEAKGGWSLLREPDIGGGPYPPPRAPPSKMKRTLAWHLEAARDQYIGKAVGIAAEALRGARADGVMNPDIQVLDKTCSLIMEQMAQNNLSRDEIALMETKFLKGAMKAGFDRRAVMDAAAKAGIDPRRITE